MRKEGLFAFVINGRENYFRCVPQTSRTAARARFIIENGSELAVNRDTHLGIYAGTFSIAARSPRGDAFGVAVCTARPAVGAMVPWVSRNGAVATQASVNTELGRKALALIDQGVPAEVAIQAVLKADGKKQYRQIHGVDANGGYGFAGSEALPWVGHRQGDGYSVAGNILTGEGVLEAMASKFEEVRDEVDFTEALILALQAGADAGGDKRGKQSAAVLVAAEESTLYHNLRVDDHQDPIAELYRIFQVARDGDPRKTPGYQGTGSIIRVKL